MKNILRSAIIVLAVAVAVGGATTAFFTDTETSANNSVAAGAVDLKVASSATRNGATVSASSWTATDLGAQQLLALADMVPGDYGTNVMTLSVADSDAWARVRLVKAATADRDVTCTEPETADDAGCAAAADGDLDDVTRIWLWNDANGDGVWDAGEATLQAPATLASVLGAAVTYDLTAAVTAAAPAHIGLGWCVGIVTGTTAVDAATCLGTGVNNAAQTDAYAVTVAFDAVQKRNNPGKSF